MTHCPCVIYDNPGFISNFAQLERGDIVCGRIKMHAHEEYVLLDLVDRGVHLIPSATAQMASRSKAFQATIFSPWMVPETVVIFSIHHLLEKIEPLQRAQITKVVVKHDRRNAGAGVLLYSSIEDVYNQAANTLLTFPFVLQPFVAECEDVRVIILDTYIEAYKRSNCHNFRKNLHCGGSATVYTPSDAILDFCKIIMERGNFPYGHLDLLITATGEVYLSEINLRGGIRGAQITIGEYKERVARIEKALLNIKLQQCPEAISSTVTPGT